MGMVSCPGCGNHNGGMRHHCKGCGYTSPVATNLDSAVVENTPPPPPDPYRSPPLSLQDILGVDIFGTESKKP